jgi:NAD(P)-dependent dehydrogenase (short-subunit alcohol dehydrogenase family)
MEPFHASIATAKAGVEGLVKSLGAELASTVRVNAIAPTITETTLAANILRNDRMKEMVERHPMKSYLKPEEVADMAAFITSEKPNQSQVKFLKWIMELSASKYN